MSAQGEVETASAFPDDFAAVRPSHPGLALAKLVVEPRSLDRQVLADELGVTEDHLAAVLSGQQPIDREFALALQGRHGELGLVLYRMQFAYDYFEQYERRPSFAALAEVVL